MNVCNKIFFIYKESWCNARKQLIFCLQLAEELQNGPLEDDEKELLLLLNTPHLKVPTRIVATATLALLFQEPLVLSRVWL